MFDRKPAESEMLSWSLVAIWIASIYAAVPMARTVQGMITKNFGSSAFLWVVAVFFLILFSAALSALRQRQQLLPGKNVVVLIAVGLIFTAWGWNLRENPERTLHFLQYGALSILCYRALLHRITDGGIYLSAIFICSVTGTIDEIIQWATPNRHFDYNDILINAGSASLIQLAIFGGMRPKIITAGKWSSLPMLLNMGAAQILLLGVCLSNTPARVKSYTEQIPFLSFLRNTAGIMTEYGYRHQHDNISFYSRLSLQELEILDRSTGLEAGQIINKSGHVSFYSEFLKRYNSLEYPLIYETRVRIFRRDSHWLRSGNYSPGDREFHRSINTAWNEHLILKSFFPVTYAASGYMLSDHDEAFLKNNALPRLSYVSPVSSHLVVRLSELQIWSLLLVLLALLSMIRVKWLRYEKT